MMRISWSAIALATTIATVAMAMPVQAGHGAIATSEAGNYGLSWDYSTLEEAASAAQRACGNDCIVREVYENTCAAIAKANTRVGWGFAPNQEKAEGIALGTCGPETCKVVAARCSLD